MLPDNEDKALMQLHVSRTALGLLEMLAIPFAGLEAGAEFLSHDNPIDFFTKNNLLGLINVGYVGFATLMGYKALESRSILKSNGWTVPSIKETLFPSLGTLNDPTRGPRNRG